MASQKIIEVNNLSASFGDKKVLDDITFNVFEKEITVIAGGSGAGKSVLLKHILGLFDITEGSVSLFGKQWSEVTEEEQNLLYLQTGVMYQNGGLLNSLTVGENIALPLEQHTNLDDKLIAYVVKMKLNLVNLLDAFYLYPNQLSGGMLKRAAIARAIVMDPPLLFVDEPGAGLDPVSLASLDKLILDLKKQLGISVVIITHEVSSIKRIADRLLFLEKGKLDFHGTLEEALKSDHDALRLFFRETVPEK